MNNFISHLTFAQSHIEAFVYPFIHSFTHWVAHVAVSHEMSLPIDSSQLTRCPVTREQLLEMFSTFYACWGVGVAYVNTFDFVYVECRAQVERGAGRMIIAIAVEIQIEIEIKIKKKRAHAAYK